MNKITWIPRFIASYHRQLSADIKMKNYEIKTSFVIPERPMSRLTKQLLLSWLFNNLGKLSVIRCYTWFSTWITTGSNPADINRFRSHTETEHWIISSRVTFFIKCHEYAIKTQLTVNFLKYAYNSHYIRNIFTEKKLAKKTIIIIIACI